MALGLGLVGKGGKVASAVNDATNLLGTGLNKAFSGLGEALIKGVPVDLMKPMAKKLNKLLEVSGFDKIGEQLMKFTGRTRAKFINDLSEYPELLQKMLNNIELIDAWKKMDDAGVDDALRRNTGALEALNAPKGSRPDPSTYLDADYIANHLENFNKEGKASRIVLKKAHDKFGVGKPDIGKTEFVSTKSEIDEILKLPLSEQAKKLGVEVQQLTGGELVRIDFNLSSKNKVEIPSGNEFGANDQWIPGGKLPGGNLEAIIKTEGMIEEIDYIVTIIQ